MDIRTTWSKLTFRQAFSLPGSDILFPPGEYDLVIEEERLQGLTFDAYRRTSAFLEVPADPRFPSRRELRPVTDVDLQQAGCHAPDADAATGIHTDADKAARKETP